MRKSKKRKKDSPDARSCKKITKKNLKRLLEIAQADMRDFFKRNRRYRNLYTKRVLCVALCQGAALHYVYGKKGIKDFDVYTFFRRNKSGDWCNRRKKSYDSGIKKFGRTADRPNYIGRRFDCFGRAISADNCRGAKEAVQRYLNERRTATARYLAQQAVVLLKPNFGQIIWPLKNHKTKQK